MPRLEEIIEPENLYGKDEYGNDKEAEIRTPFDPKKVDIISQTMVISNIVAQLKADEIILNPEFQRNAGLWDDQKQSRLIESLIIKIPLPTFYFDYADDDKLIVVDGLQRLFAIKRFIALCEDDPNRLRLTGLEYLKEFSNMKFEDLPATIRRRINEQTIVAYVIRLGTPEPVRNSIFTRINTGGIQLTPAEIKNSVYRGQAAELLKELAHSKEFIAVTNHKVPSERMLDCEFVNRFLAFYIIPLDKYEENLEEYYNIALMRIKYATPEMIDGYREAFYRSMRLSLDLFRKKAFRKIDRAGHFSKINKPLFECVTVVFARLNKKTISDLKERSNIFWKKYQELLHQSGFVEAITGNTASKVNINRRNDAFCDLIKETVGYDQIF